MFVRILKNCLLLALVVVPTSSAYAYGPCQNQFHPDLHYTPSTKACGGRAALVVTGKLLRSFSLVLRDCNNDDRDPCYDSENSCGTNKSSPYKAQSTLNAVVEKKGQEVAGRVFCMKERGDSEIYKLVRRVTIKVRNPVRNPDTDLLKYCMRTRTKAINGVSILRISDRRSADFSAPNAYCSTQKYLGCDISYAAICPQY